MQNIQGDIIAVKLTKKQLPDNLVFESATKNVIVAEGETTGHKHTLVVDRPQTKIGIAKDKNGYFIQVSMGSAVLTHDKHEVQTLEKGLWFIGQQEEYSEKNEWLKVQD